MVGVWVLVMVFICVVAILAEPYLKKLKYNF
jgi:hypothetical protein